MDAAALLPVESASRLQGVVCEVTSTNDLHAALAACVSWLRLDLTQIKAPSSELQSPLCPESRHVIASQRNAAMGQ